MASEHDLRQRKIGGGGSDNTSNAEKMKELRKKEKVPYKKAPRNDDDDISLMSLMPKLCFWIFKKIVKLNIYLFLLSIIGIILALFLVTSPIQPEKYNLKRPRRFEGILKPNYILSHAQRLFEYRIEGPESIAVHPITGKLYTGTADGKIWVLDTNEMKILAELGEPPCGGGWHDELNCGRPLGMRFDVTGRLIVADAYKGLFSIDRDNGDFIKLYSSKEPVDHKKPKFLNDLDITSDGKIYFSDSSVKWQRRDVSYLVLEGKADGRILCFDPKLNKTEVVIDNLVFPNGVQLSPKEDFLLIAETTMARIKKFYLTGPKKGKLETFIDNLPGLPDNIRASSSGGYWVAFAGVRRKEKFSLLEWASTRPWFKKYLTKVVPQVLLFKAVPSYGLIVEINQNGKIRRSYHDPDAEVLSSVSQVTEFNKVLYLGSYYLPYISMVDLNTKP
ncbi:adipocyte plasma membrane-associated protein-like isoform X2 [Tubulanus polymorphus]|uniref:adipocyte plasma membrane-associated protein-like isoform X2 n=1 Tax=Tubulanus polymorphus TaxID=672921 RepID=UPI003DA6C735